MQYVAKLAAGGWQLALWGVRPVLDWTIQNEAGKLVGAVSMACRHSPDAAGRSF